MTPNVAIIHVHNPHWRGMRLSIPLFLLWIPFVLVSPLLIFILLMACMGLQINLFRATSVFWGILCSLPGTNVRVEAQGNQILVEIR